MATLTSTEEVRQRPPAPGEIEVPASTALAHRFGFWLHTNVRQAFLQAYRSASSALSGQSQVASGWFREVLPHEHEETVPVVPEKIRLTTERRTVDGFGCHPSVTPHGFPSGSYLDSSGVKAEWRAKHRHGVFLPVLTDTEGRKRLVSHQSTRGQLPTGNPSGSSPLNSIHFNADTSRLHFLLRSLSPFLLACSTGAMLSHFSASCDFTWRISGHRCCGRGWSTRSSAC